MAKAYGRIYRAETKVKPKLNDYLRGVPRRAETPLSPLRKRRVAKPGDNAKRRYF